jgi:hypothetical protein
MLNALDALLKHTLRSVWFGIILLSAIAVYIAIGSGFPRVREYFEKDELAFFNSWPLITLMILMTTTLIVVTIERIPFTAPRMGAWIIHTGIVTLVFGAFWHYSSKVEGQALIPVGQTATHYFDRWERALYLRSQSQTARVPLVGLPRFYAYDETLGNADYLDRGTLKNLNPVVPGQQVMTAADLLGVKDLKFSVVGYWPYADIRERLIDVPGVRDTGLSLTLPDPDTPGERMDVLLVGANIRYARTSWNNAIEFEHRVAGSQEEVQKAIDASKRLHQLKIAVAGQADQTHTVSVGETINLIDSGYGLFVEAFNPRWQTMDRKTRPMLTLMVTPPDGKKFRRQVLVDVEKPTDWVLGAEGAGPMGKRQDAPLDDKLKITYTLDDAAKLLPREGNAQYTFYTTADSPVTTLVVMPLNERASAQTIDPSRGDKTFRIKEPISADQAMMATAGGQHVHGRQEFDVPITRREGVGVEQYVKEVPREKRNKDTGEGGLKQIARVRATAGDWKQDVFVPYTPQATQFAWRGGLLEVPGAKAPAQLQLSNTLRSLPANIRLDRFEAEAYGGFEAQGGAMIRQFKSHITITDRTSGEQTPGVVSLNDPVFYGGNYWIFFQSQWDPEGQQFTVLGIGNRPGVLPMMVGCVLIFGGIFYAFYVKPILLRVMKKNAIEKAERDQRLKRPPPASAKPVATV